MLGEVTEETVVLAIRRRALDGLSVAGKDFEDDSLVRGACDIYGSWPVALLCAGIPVELLRPGKATKTVTILAVRQLLARGCKTAQDAERAGHGRWVRESEKHFGSWKKALKWAAAHPLEQPVLKMPERPRFQDPEGLTLQEVADLTGLSKATIYKAVTSGELAAVRVRRSGDRAATYLVVPGALPVWVAERQARFECDRGLRGERLTVKAAAERFGCKPALLQRAIGSARLPAELAPSKRGAFVYIVGEEDVRELLS